MVSQNIILFLPRKKNDIKINAGIPIMIQVRYTECDIKTGIPVCFAGNTMR